MRIIRAILRTIAAGAAAIAVLCGIFSIYALDPVHIDNPRGNTDYVWPANSLWIQMKEGISWGRYDANGFNNLTVIDDPDILILGSSHMEAKNVMQDANTASVLGELLESTYSVYNMGISGHHFTKVCKYLPTTMALYEQPPAAIVIETDNVFFTRRDVDELLQGTLETTPSHGGVIALLQKLPFFRLGYHQLTGGLLDLLLDHGSPASQTSASVKAQRTADEAVYDDLFACIHDTMKDYDTQVIIVYHPTASLCADGTVTFGGSSGADVFAEKCAEYGFTFVNMEQDFARMYADAHKLPHGFSTGEAGYGHLNADGHQCIALALADAITQLKEDGALCR